MKIFFNTKFTGQHKNATLISIGIISEKEHTFYAEFSDYCDALCDDWVEENIIKYLRWGNKGDLYENFIHEDGDGNNWEVFGSIEYIRIALINWLARSGEDRIELVSDRCHFNMVLFIDSFGGSWNLPGQICPVCHDINRDISDFFKVSEEYSSYMSREGIIESFNQKMKDYWPDECLKIKRNKPSAVYDAMVIKGVYHIINE